MAAAAAAAVVDAPGLQRLAAAATEQLRRINPAAQPSAADHKACTDALDALADAWRAASPGDMAAAAQPVAASGLFSAIAAACHSWEGALAHLPHAAAPSAAACQAATARMWAMLHFAWPEALLPPADGQSISLSVSDHSMAASVLPVAAWALACLRSDQAALLPMQTAVLALVDVMPVVVDDVSHASPVWSFKPGATAASWVTSDALLQLLLARLAVDAARMHRQHGGRPPLAPGAAADAAALDDGSKAVPDYHTALLHRLGLPPAAVERWLSGAASSTQASTASSGGNETAPSILFAALAAFCNSTGASSAAAGPAAAAAVAAPAPVTGGDDTAGVLYAISKLLCRRVEAAASSGVAILPGVHGRDAEEAAWELLLVQLEVASLAADAGTASAAVQNGHESVRAAFKALRLQAGAFSGGMAAMARMHAVMQSMLMGGLAGGMAADVDHQSKRLQRQAARHATACIAQMMLQPTLELLLPAVWRLALAASDGSNGDSSNDYTQLALCQDAGLLLLWLLGPGADDAALLDALDALDVSPDMWLPMFEAFVRSLGTKDAADVELFTPLGVPSTLGPFLLLELPQCMAALVQQALPAQQVAAAWQRPVCTLLASCLKLAHLAVLTHPPLDAYKPSQINRARWQLLLLAISTAQAAATLGKAAAAAAGSGGGLVHAATPWMQLLARALVLAADALEPDVEEDERAGGGLYDEGLFGSDSDDSDASASVDEDEDEQHGAGGAVGAVQGLRGAVGELRAILRRAAADCAALQGLQQQAAALVTGLDKAVAACERDEDAEYALFSSDLLQAARKAMRRQLAPMRRLAKALAGELPSPWLCNSPSCCTVAGAAEGACVTRCGRCRRAALCGDACQRAIWPHHKAACARQAKVAGGGGASS